jgi:hypothetical protein
LAVVEELADRLRRDARRHVARAVAAHPVGHDEEVVLLEHDEGVFVVLALEPDVAQPGRDARIKTPNPPTIKAFHPA